jgi:hypothetical protein
MSRRADIEGKAGNEGKGNESTCSKLISDSEDEAIDLFEAEDDMVLIGEIATV